MKTLQRTLATLLLASAPPLVTAEGVRVSGKEAAPEPKGRSVASALRYPGLPLQESLEVRLHPFKPPSAPDPSLGSQVPGMVEKRLQVGSRRDVASEAQTVSAPASLRWQPAPGGGRVARVQVTSPQAASLRLGLRIRGLPAQAELRFASPLMPERVAGPVRADTVLASMRALGVFWTPLTEGETQFVEAWIPEGSDAGRVRIDVDSASHLVASPSRQFKAAGVGAAQACHEDVACVAAGNPALARAARSVAKLLYTENGVSYVCSGTLIGDGDAASQVPYLYTAAHCVGSQAAAATLNTFWFFEASRCGGKESANYRQLSGGATLLHANEASDAALLRLAERAPEGAWFSGWDSLPLDSSAPLVALHHPAGDLKKLSLGKAMGITAAAGGATYETAAWSSGSTEAGSSGSGLFTLHHGEYLLRGGLRGGSASCASTGRMEDPSNRDYYSRLEQEAVAMRSWLASGPAPLEDYTDLWSNPDEPGWGVTIVQSAANRVFATWYTYDADHRPLWFVMPEGAWRTAATLEGTLYRASGSAFDRPHDRAESSLWPVGTGRIEFGHGDAATATFKVDGKTVVKTIRRQAI